MDFAMGLETLAFVALSAVGASQKMSAARKQAKADVAEAEMQMQQHARDVKRKSASLTASFFNSGLALEGTPMASIMGFLDTGIADLTQMQSVANRRAKNIITSARSDAIQGIVSSFASSSALSSIGSGLSDFGSAFSKQFNPITQVGGKLGTPTSPAGLWASSSQPLPWRS